MKKHPNEAFTNLNIHSKLINVSELARRINTTGPALKHRINGTGRHKALSPTELINIEEIIKNDLNL